MSAIRGRRLRKKPMADINVVPYIDVMLVLLVIFMATAPMMTQGVSVDLPQTRTAATTLTWAATASRRRAWKR